MNKIIVRSATTLPLLFVMSPAFADLTAQNVWEDMRVTYQRSGYTISVQESTSGGVLTLNDLSLTTSVDDPAGGKVETAINAGTLILTELGDGTVQVSYPDQASAQVKVFEGNTNSLDVAIDMAITDGKVLVSGDPSELTYESSVGGLAMNVSRLMIDPEDLSANAVIKANLANLTGTTINTPADLYKSNQKLNADAMTLEVLVTDPDDSENRLAVNGTMNAITTSGVILMPLWVNGQDPMQMFKSGFSVDGAFEYQGGTFDFTFSDRGDGASGTSKSSYGQLSFAMDKDHIRYELADRGAEYFMTSTQMPLPINVSAAASSFGLTMPLSVGDDKDFKMNLSMEELQVSDLLWSMFDPQSILPRDPVTIVAKVSGKAKIMADLSDPAALDPSQMPGEVNSVSIDEILVRGAGAEITANGAFTLDNTDLTTFDGVPRPEGAADIRIVGANGLIDKLIQMGMIGEDEAMGARMMMGMFTIADGEDNLKSRIEVNDKGHVSANGQRLR